MRAGVPPMRGAMPVETGVPDALGAPHRGEMSEHGVAGEPLGIDIPDMVTLVALQREGIDVADAQP